MTPSERLAAAQVILSDPDKRTGSWLRAACLLTRQALDDEVTELVDRKVPGAGKGTAALRLIVLRTCVDAALSRQVTWTWNGLSRACHHRGYELNPSIADVRGWMRVVEALLEPSPTA